MTDKSFGDHMNRNIVKNPLLSSAVTGLSIQDLTYNAVLLPVSRSQEVITRPDQQFGTQTQTLGNTDHVTSNDPSGDANSNPITLTQPQNLNPTPLGTDQNIKIEKTYEKPCYTQSKASDKSEDDFDVNEYFARLQGTRYVSAPLNSSLKEDQNANLEATEENLEEINLNEPDKSQTDIQQSITADIAQNFSQLPTVLPQVASAVFSSFSNMLSMKSREQTPDDVKRAGYQDLQFQRPEETVPLMGVPEVKEMGPPPKELPTVGTSNYRLSTKKKYAQIPGLSSGDTAHIPVYDPISRASVPSYFVPSNTSMVPNVTEDKKLQEINETNDTVDVKKADDCHDQLSTNTFPNPATEKQTYGFFNPTDYIQSIPVETRTPDSQSNAALIKTNSNIFVSKEEKPEINIPRTYNQPPSQFHNQPSQDNIGIPTASNAAIIPPPPMFSNIPRKDGQTSVGRAILPPSVARRVSANQPLIKSQAATVSAFADNIFVPAPVSDTMDVSNVTQNLNASLPPTAFAPSAFAPFNIAGSSPQNASIFSPASVPLSSSVPSDEPVSRLPSSTLPFVPSPQQSSEARNLYPPTGETNLSSQISSKFAPPSNLGSNIPPFSHSATPLFPSDPSMPVYEPAVTPAIFTPPSISQSETNLPPPIFFSLSTMPHKVTNIDSNVTLSTPQFGATNTAPVESVNPMPEPPKVSGNLSYRMTKKRPQYYSGPIEGVGAISNNVKPVLQPMQPIGTSSFHGALFTPAQQAQETVNQNLTSPNVDQATVPFDINRPDETISSYAYDFNQSREHSYIQPEFNTAFDFSRQITENIETPKQEIKGFGIIGSLKSKLSSLDINKIQNTVTTFFDPAYNDTKKEGSSNQETVPYGHQQSPASSYGQYSQSQTSNFEIFVPNIEQTTPQIYDHQVPSQNNNPFFDQAQENQQYYQQQDQYKNYQNQGQHDPASSYTNYSTQPNFFDISVKANAPELYSAPIQSNNQGSIPVGAADIHKNNAQSDNNVKAAMPSYTQDNLQQFAQNDTTGTDSGQISNQSIIEPELRTSAISFFDISQPHKAEYIDSNITSFQMTPDIPDKFKSDDLPSSFTSEDQKLEYSNFGKTSDNAIKFFTSPTYKVEKAQQNPFTTFTIEENKVQENLLNTQEHHEKPAESPNLDVASVALLGLTTMLADKSQELTDLENDIKNMTLNETSRNVDTIFNRGSHAGFFDDMSLKNKPSNEFDKNNLDLCETCREVAEPEDRDADDLTVKLIENIISPIQLLNPVEVPLTEHNTPVDNRVDVDSNFDSNQCAEISYITEETIETIQVQSATELLEADQLDNPNIRSYGWCSDDKSFAAAKVLAQQDYNLKNPNPLVNHDYMSPNSIVDHNYSSQINPNSGGDHCYSLPNPSSIGFFVNNSLFTENIPTNASDEIKAEFKFTHDDVPVVLPRQMSIPSAPPAEDDSKSDETGIDVHSIEADAKKDFAFLEEYAIEPSETDDEKIDYKGREGSVEHIQEDSFTHRVERFKKMETVSDAFEFKKKSPYHLGTTTSPSVPIASYFDTGNYAADTYYKNSLTSPNLTLFNMGSSNALLRIPPGFEEEFQKRLSGLSSQANSKENRNNIPFSIPYIPDTSTQTRPTFSPTFCTSQTYQNLAVGSTVVSKMSEFVQQTIPTRIESEISPDFDRIVDNIREDSPVLTKIPSVINSPSSAIHESVFERTQGQVQNVPSVIDDSNQLSHILESNTLPDFTMFAVTKERIQEDALEISSANPNAESQEDISKPLQEDISKLLGFSNVLAAKEVSPETTHIFTRSDIATEDKTEKSQSQKILTSAPPNLPDPINFFSSNLEFGSTQKSDGDNNTSNRLASYFGSPTKTDTSKSFFELSQGQDHYRLNTSGSKIGSGDTKESDVKSFFEQRQNPNPFLDNKIQNIPQDKYIANLNLMRDLTSIQNVEVNPDQIVRTVNYFTVEYNNEHLDFTSEYNVGEPEIVVKKDNLKKVPNTLSDTEETVYDDETAVKILKACKYCCNLKCGYVKNIDVYHESVETKDFKVKKNMDNNSEPKKGFDNNMEQSRDCGKRNSISVDFGSDPEHQDANETAIQMSENRSTSEYTPVKHHWFYRVDVEGKSIWRGFSIVDSKALEDAFHSPDLDDNTLVATDGGRFDVNVMGRLRIAVYWTDKPVNVRRCSWFYKGTTDARYVPYSESVADKLELEYRHGVTTGEWHRRLVLPNNELVVMHGPAVMVHFLQSGNTDTFNTPPQSSVRPRVVRRGCEETEIEDIEPSNIDHLLLLCHGVGSACDMRFRSVEEVVDDFRTTSLQLLQSHYKNSYDSGVVGRVEVLPISWHATLHSGETGVDRRLARITLDSIPRLRNFTNDTVLDVLFYTSPVFCQTIIDTVCTELNRIYKLFCARNPEFSGGVSVGGHSLGSVILYDLLCHQAPVMPLNSPDKRYVNGAAGTGQPTVQYPRLEFSPVALYALGSPIAIFECIRGVESLGLDFKLPTCINFFNIFHPYDPIAYRIEPLINAQMRDVKPYLIPHHKGRKRMHLELKDTMARVGADIKQKLIESIKSTWSNMWKTQPPPTDRQLEKVVEEEMEKEQLTEESNNMKDEGNGSSEPLVPEMLGKLNAGRRIDYVLQEAPFEMINEYLFAMSSHVCYWESEDTMLMMLREIYDALGVQPDCTVPQQSMSVQRARAARNDERIVVSTSEHPSTSRDGT